MFNSVSIFMPNAFSIRSAISADSAALPLIRSDRVNFRCLAPGIHLYMQQERVRLGQIEKKLHLGNDSPTLFPKASPQAAAS